MPTLISVDEFRERFDIDSDIPYMRIDPHIGSASRRLRKWVGDVQYAAAVAVAGNEDTDLELVTDLKNAEAHLTYHFAILGLNTAMSSKGILLQSRTSEGGREIRQFLPPEDITKLAMQFLELAREIADPYIAGTDTDNESGIEVVTNFVENVVIENDTNIRW